MKPKADLCLAPCFQNLKAGQTDYLCQLEKGHSGGHFFKNKLVEMTWKDSRTDKIQGENIQP